MKFSETVEFGKELKKLSKKYKTLPEDLAEFKKVISSIPLGTSKHFTVLHVKEDMRIVKARLFCRYLRGSSLRVVYTFHEEKGLIVFIELYFKGEKEEENRERIRDYLEDI